MRVPEGNKGIPFALSRLADLYAGRRYTARPNKGVYTDARTIGARRQPLTLGSEFDACGLTSIELQEFK